MESDMTRRDILKTVAKTTVGFSAISGVLGANDRVRVAVCGLNGRGKDHIHGFSRVPNVEIAALCDVDENMLRKRREELGGKPQAYVACASCWKTGQLMRSPLPHQITGMR